MITIEIHPFGYLDTAETRELAEAIAIREIDNSRNPMRWVSISEQSKMLQEFRHGIEGMAWHAVATINEN